MRAAAALVLVALACALPLALAAPVRVAPIEADAPFAYVRDIQSPAFHAHVNAAQSSWRAGRNARFDGASVGDVAALCGVLPQAHSTLPQKVVVPVGAIPATFDARTAWPTCSSIQQIRDQAACGSCWAFGAVEAMSDRICVASSGKIQVEISAQDMLTCCSTCGMGCNGGWPESAWRHASTTGIVSGFLYNSSYGCQDYSIPPCDHHVVGKLQPCGDIVPTPKCARTCQTGYNNTYANDKHYFTSIHSISSKVTDIQTEIMTHGPVEGSFTVYADFPTYKSGVYQHTSGQALGGHAIKILGWGTESNVDYWLVANSWNTDWGAQGFFKIRRGVNECGIESGIVAGLPKL